VTSSRCGGVYDEWRWRISPTTLLRLDEGTFAASAFAKRAGRGATIRPYWGSWRDAQTVGRAVARGRVNIRGSARQIGRERVNLFALCCSESEQVSDVDQFHSRHRPGFSGPCLYHGKPADSGCHWDGPTERAGPDRDDVLADEIPGERMMTIPNVGGQWSECVPVLCSRGYI